MDARDAVRLVGRRAALRYALAGFAAAALAACSRDGGSTSIKSQTLAAFLQGTWDFRAENGNGAQITVAPGGTWLLTGGGAGSPAWSDEGTWSLEGGRLSTSMTTNLHRRDPHVVQDVPDEAVKALAGTYAVSGGLTDSQEEGYRKMQVSYSKDTVVLTFPDYVEEGQTRVVTCTRVKRNEAP